MLQFCVLSSLVVFALRVQYCLPEGRKQNSLRLRWMESQMMDWTLQWQWMVDIADWWYNASYNLLCYCLKPLQSISVWFGSTSVPYSNAAREEAFHGLRGTASPCKFYDYENKDFYIRCQVAPQPTPKLFVYQTKVTEMSSMKIWSGNHKKRCDSFRTELQLVFESRPTNWKPLRKFENDSYIIMHIQTKSLAHCAILALIFCSPTVNECQQQETNQC